jgi:hypothetical protein
VQEHLLSWRLLSAPEVVTGVNGVQRSLDEELDTRERVPLGVSPCCLRLCGSLFPECMAVASPHFALFDGNCYEGPGAPLCSFMAFGGNLVVV